MTRILAGNPKIQKVNDQVTYWNEVKNNQVINQMPPQHQKH